MEIHLEFEELEWKSEMKINVLFSLVSSFLRFLLTPFFFPPFSFPGGKMKKKKGGETEKGEREAGGGGNRERVFRPCCVFVLCPISCFSLSLFLFFLPSSPLFSSFPSFPPFLFPRLFFFP